MLGGSEHPRVRKVEMAGVPHEWKPREERERWSMQCGGSRWASVCQPFSISIFEAIGRSEASGGVGVGSRDFLIRVLQGFGDKIKLSEQLQWCAVCTMYDSAAAMRCTAQSLWDRRFSGDGDDGDDASPMRAIERPTVLDAHARTQILGLDSEIDCGRCDS